MKAKAVQVVEAEGMKLPEFWNLNSLPCQFSNSLFILRTRFKDPNSMRSQLCDSIPCHISGVKGRLL